jgi:diguanylate cyclase (GGDEF)-like protein
MNWTIFAGVLLVNTLIAISMAILLSRKRAAPGSQAMMMMFVALAAWTLCYAMITLSTTMAAKVAWLKFENIGIVTTPVFWIIFAVRYTRNEKWLPRPALALLFLVPAITLVLLFSGRWFTLYYSGVHVPAAGLGPVHIERSGWYLVQLIQNYLVLVLGFALLLWQMFRLRELYRRQIAFVLAALIVPLGFNLLYQRGGSLLPQWDPSVDLTPISFMITAVLASVGVIGLRLFDLIPIARNVVIENIPELVLVVDAYNRILDANQVTFSWLGKSPGEIIGRNVMEVFSAWPGLAGRFQDTYETREEILFPGVPPRTYELTISPVYSRPGVLEGRVILAHDVTARKSIEDELTRANAALTLEIAEKALLQEKLREQATRDPLTGVFNRRYLAEALENEVARAERDETSISVVILDVDHFKEFNDRLGHKCGDVVLQALSAMLREESRRSDIVCRYGGEEFVIVLPNTPLEVGTARAEEWRAMFEALAVAYEGQHVHAAFSAGVACLPQHGTTSEAILRAADHALYESKANGRNRVTVFSVRQSSSSASPRGGSINEETP